MTKTIEVIISPTGETRLTTTGFSGADCQLASRFIEQSLGQLQAQQFTPEYFTASHNHSRLEINNGGSHSGQPVQPGSQRLS